MTKRKVVCVFGKFDDKSDFVLEPSCPESCKCEICKDAFLIEDVKQEPIKKSKRGFGRPYGYSSNAEKANNSDEENTSSSLLKSASSVKLQSSSPSLEVEDGR